MTTILISLFAGIIIGLFLGQVLRYYKIIGK